MTALKNRRPDENPVGLFAFGNVSVSMDKVVQVTKTEVVVVIGIPDPEVPILRWLVDVASGLRVEEFALVEVHGVTLGFATFGGSEMLFALELFGKIRTAIPTVFCVVLGDQNGVISLWSSEMKVPMLDLKEAFTGERVRHCRC